MTTISDYSTYPSLAVDRSLRKAILEVEFGGSNCLIEIPSYQRITAWRNGGRSHHPRLSSCMHAGTRIVRLTKSTGDWKIEVLAKFEEHESMNYGSDSQPELNAQGQRTFISTSFYDRLLCLWRY